MAEDGAAAAAGMTLAAAPAGASVVTAVERGKEMVQMLMLSSLPNLHSRPRVRVWSEHKATLAISEDILIPNST